MKSWSAYIQYMKDGRARYSKIDFDISSEEYEILLEASEDLYPFKALDIYDELIEKAKEKASSFAPLRIVIEDPGDLERFKERFIGYPYEAEEKIFLRESGARNVSYEVEFESVDGCISDMRVSAKADSGDECWPDYDRIARDLIMILDDIE